MLDEYEFISEIEEGKKIVYKKTLHKKITSSSPTNSQVCYLKY